MSEIPKLSYLHELALYYYAKAHGKTWKKSLRKFWNDKTIPRDPFFFVLKNVGKEHGAEWLKDYQAPETEPKASDYKKEE